MNPLDWTGPDFLGLYVPLLAAAFLAGLWLRWWSRQSGGSPEVILLPSEPYEVATLRGPGALIEAALASLAHQGLIRVEGSKLVASGKVSFTAPLIERIVHAAVEAGDTQQWELVRKAEPAIEQLRAPLVRRGWMLDETGSLRARLLPALPGLAVLVLGFAKFVVGLERERPVAFLVFFSLPLAVWCVWMAVKAPWRSRLGDKVLEQLRREREPLKQTASTAGSAMNSRDVALAVGLYGLTAVGMHELEDMRRYLESHGYGGSGSSSGDTGDSGGDGGCGGGGCGGCGGGGD